jgi:hypothetical protein
MWTHGSAVVLAFPGGAGGVGARFTPGHQMEHVTLDGTEIEWSDIVGFRGGRGSTFRSKGVGQPSPKNNFTFAIPTPAFINRPGNNQELAALKEVMVLYEVTGGATVDAVEVMDGGMFFGRGDIISSRFSNLNISNVSFMPQNPDSLQSLFVPNKTIWQIVDPSTNNPATAHLAISVGVSVIWHGEGTVTFAAAGAGFFID